MRLPKVLLLNGPPRCGKDTVGGIVAELVDGVHRTKFAKLLKERTHALYGAARLPHDFFESRKDEPVELFLGKTPRQAYIAVSETYMKPQHGVQVFGQFLAQDITETARAARLVVVTDSGFQEEASALMESFECYLMRIHREGCDFSNDSRSYIELDVPTLDLPNDSTLGILRSMVQLGLQELRLA